MLIAEYDYDTDMRVKQEEATEITKLANAKNFIKLKLLSLEQIAEAIQLPLEDVKKLSAATEQRRQLEHAAADTVHAAFRLCKTC